MTKNAMQKPEASAKPSYPELVRARAKKLYEQASKAGGSDEAIEMIYDALKQTALESWKNGLAAAQRRSKGKPAETA